MIDQLRVTCQSAQLYAPKNVRVFRKANEGFFTKVWSRFEFGKERTAHKERERFVKKISRNKGSIMVN